MEFQNPKTSPVIKNKLLCELLKDEDRIKKIIEEVVKKSNQDQKKLIACLF